MYRSGHNEAVLKTVCPKGHRSSNLLIGANHTTLTSEPRKGLYTETYPSGEGTPLLREQGAKASRGFKSHRLRHVLYSTPLSLQSFLADVRVADSSQRMKMLAVL